MNNEPLRILQLYPKADYFTGAAIQLRDLAIGLARRGHAVTVATPASEIWAERMRAEGIGYAPIPMERAWDVRAAWRIAKVVRAGHIQVAHAHTENRIVALACTRDERLIAGLSSWKDVVIYNVEERRVAFVRQIKDNLGWYDHAQAFIFLAGNAEAIITAGISQGSASQGVPSWSINVFQSIQWSPV